MSDFSFGKINVKSRKQVVNLKTYDSPLLMDKSNARASYDLPIVILTEEHFEQKEISYIDRFLASEGITRYIMLDAINCEYSEKDASGTLRITRWTPLEMQYIRENFPQFLEPDLEVLAFNNYFFIGSPIQEVGQLATYLEGNI